MQALYYRKANNYSNYFIRIKYKNAPLLLDVFPCDFYGKTLSDEEKISKSDFIKAEREKLEIIFTGLDKQYINIIQKTSNRYKMVFSS